MNFTRGNYNIGGRTYNVGEFVMTTAAGYLANGKLGAINAAAAYLFNQMGEPEGGGQGGEYRHPADGRDGTNIAPGYSHANSERVYMAITGHYPVSDDISQQVAYGWVCVACTSAINNPRYDQDYQLAQESCNYYCDVSGVSRNHSHYFPPYGPHPRYAPKTTKSLEVYKPREGGASIRW